VRNIPFQRQIKCFLDLAYIKISPQRLTLGDFQATRATSGAVSNKDKDLVQKRGFSQHKKAGFFFFFFFLCVTSDIKAAKEIQYRAQSE